MVPQSGPRPGFIPQLKALLTRETQVRACAIVSVCVCVHVVDGGGSGVTRRRGSVYLRVECVDVC